MSQSTKSKSSNKTSKNVEQKETPKVQETAVATPAPVVEQVVEKKSTKKQSTKTTEVAVQEAAPVKTAEKEVETKSTKSTKSAKSKSSKKSKKATKPKVVAKTEQEGGEGEEEKGKRYFHCVYKSNDGTVVRAGRYCGKKPKQAARKALSRVVEKNEVENGKSLLFLIKECTRGSKKKMYAYSGSRVPLETPVTVPLKKLNKDGKPVVLTYKHANNVKKVALEECGDLVNVQFDEEDNTVAPVQEATPVVKVTKKSGSKKSSSKKETTSTQVVEAKVPTPVAVEEAPKKKSAKKEEVKPVEAAVPVPVKEEVKVEKTKTKSKAK